MEQTAGWATDTSDGGPDTADEPHGVGVKEHALSWLDNASCGGHRKAEDVNGDDHNREFPQDPGRAGGCRYPATYRLSQTSVLVAGTYDPCRENGPN